MTLFLLRTCLACPEQYNVYTEDGSQAGYIRLRWGTLSLEYPDTGCDLAYCYNFPDNLKGSFDNEEERETYINEIIDVIKEKLFIEGDVNLEVFDDTNKLMERIYGTKEEV